MVQPNAYGDDNRCTLDAVAELGLERARAVVALRPDVDEATLAAMHAAGARAVRVMGLPGVPFPTHHAERAGASAQLYADMLLEASARNLRRRDPAALG